MDSDGSPVNFRQLLCLGKLWWVESVAFLRKLSWIVIPAYSSLQCYKPQWPKIVDAVPTMATRWRYSVLSCWDRLSWHFLLDLYWWWVHWAFSMRYFQINLKISKFNVVFCSVSKQDVRHHLYTKPMSLIPTADIICMCFLVCICICLLISSIHYWLFNLVSIWTKKAHRKFNCGQHRMLIHSFTISSERLWFELW